MPKMDLLRAWLKRMAQTNFRKRMETYKRLKIHHLANAAGHTERNELSKASEMLWEATACAIKEFDAATETLLRRHKELGVFMEQIGIEAKDPDFGKDFAAAERMHANFYDDFLEEIQVKADFGRTRILLRKLEERTQQYLAKQQSEN